MAPPPGFWSCPSFNPKQRKNIMSTATVRGQYTRDDADIQALIETVHKAHHNKDAAAIVAAYARDAVVFNLAPPLSHHGMDLEEKKAWLDTWEGPIEYESSDLNITVSGDFAFCHGFYRLGGTPKAAGRSVSGCARRYACIETGAPGGLFTSTHPCRSTWMAACGPPLTSSPKLTHRDTRTDGLSSGSLSLFPGSRRFRAGK